MTQRSPSAPSAWRLSALVGALTLVCATQPAHALCWGLGADRLPDTIASTPADFATCSRYIRTMQIASRSAAGDLGVRTAELARLQKAYFEGYCARHPQAQAFLSGAAANLRAAEAYVPSAWEIELRAANVADAAANNAAAAAHEASALRLLPPEASPADVSNVYAQVGCLRASRNDMAGALAAYRDGLGRIGEAPLRDRTLQVQMLFGASTLLASMGRDQEAFDFGQRASEAYLASEFRIVTQGTQLSSWMFLLSTHRLEPFATLQRQVADAMLQDTGPYVDRTAPGSAAPLTMEQRTAVSTQIDRDLTSLRGMQRETSDRNMAGATRDIREAEARLAQASVSDRAGVEASLLRLKIRLAELQMWDAAFWSQMEDPQRALQSVTLAMQTWSMLRLPESGSTLASRITKFKLLPASDPIAALDAYASMYAAFDGLAARGAITTSSQAGRDDAVLIVDAAWSLSH